MDSTASIKFGRSSLPRLSTSKELSRRDSQSSSRTRDSGYNSDLDVSCSPLDCVDSNQHTLRASIPPLTSMIFRNTAFQVPTFRAHQQVFSPPRSCITSCPADVEVLPTKPLRNASDYGLDNTSIVFTDHHLSPGLPVQDDQIEKWIKDNLPSHRRPDTRVSSIVSLSSASSCDMYTETDMSDNEHETDTEAPQHALSSSTLKTIDIVMRKIELNLRFAAHMQCNGSNNTSPSNSNISTSQQTSRRAPQGTGKRKIRSDDNLSPDDDQEEGCNKRRRGSAVTMESCDKVLRFACPFYKHEPHRFRNRRTCPGPGWPTVHRMKEHLYRAHAQSIYCPRCYVMFDADVDLSNHLRSAQCDVSAPQPIEGIDRETLKALRKRSPAFRLEEDKWRDVYHLLFPEVALEDIPSPFYEADSPSEDSRRFRRELLRRVQEELVVTAGQLSGPVERQLLQQVAHIIRRCENDMLTSFDSSASQVPSLVDRRPSDTSTTSTSSTQPTLINETSISTHPGVSNASPPSIPPSSQGQIIHGNGSPMWPHQTPIRSRTAPEQHVIFAPVSWDPFSTQNSYTEYIDLESMFPSQEETCNEPFAEFAVPMWTR